MRFLGRRQLLFATILGAALAAPSVATAQTGKLTGVVTDTETGRPVEGVQVQVQGTPFGAQTGANGRYFIVAIPPGSYTVSARRIGYQSIEVTNLVIAIDATRDQNFSMTASASLTTVVIRAEQAPLIERNTVGSKTTITADVIQALPVTSINGVLALQQGFTEVPDNTNLVSLNEEQRSTTPSIRVRGGRGGSTLSMVDGIPTLNSVFGSNAIDVNPLAVSAIDFARGHMDPQYGNALSGVINTAIREGGTSVAGSMDYQNSTLPGAVFGNRQDQLLGSNVFRGVLSGPVPITDNRLRYVIGGVVESGASRVLEFDDVVNSPNTPTSPLDLGVLPPDVLDLERGWQAFGGRKNQQFLGKITFLPSSNIKINATVIDQSRQNLGYDRRYRLVAVGDPWDIVNNIVDSLSLQGQRNFQNITQPSVQDQSRFYSGSLDWRFGRSNLQLRAGQLEFNRNTCNVFNGICVPDVFTNANFREQFIAPFGVPGVPFPGTGLVSGGETITTRTFRADLQSQVTDHNNLQVGVQVVDHDITYIEKRGISGNSGLAPIVNQVYRASPLEVAGYIQSVIEYDFLTVRLGGRFDYGRARGLGYTDPLQPTAGTTARDVCEGATVGGRQLLVNGAAPGTAGCLTSPTGASGRPELLDSATAIAALDDFRDAPARTAFSPRVGVAFPLTERSNVFFNAGRYTMNPLYSNIYRNSGIGTVAGPGDGYCSAGQVKPGTNECYPSLVTGNPEFVGNPNLLLEQATQFEVGYGAEIGGNYAFTAAVFNRDESGLTGLLQARPQQDIGSTYNGLALPDFRTVVNQDFLTARGIETQFRRRVSNRWGWDMNYGWSRTTTNAPPPDRSQEIEQGGELDRTALRELIADIDQTHRLNVSFIFATLNDVPELNVFGRNAGALLRNTNASLTFSWASGFPYTPVRGITLGQVGNLANATDINSGRAPSTQTVNLIMRKDLQVKNVRYGAFLRVSNLLDRRNCVQVFVNTGNCDAGLRDFLNRRVGNTGENTSTSLDQPEFIGARRSLFTGLTINF